MAGRSRNMLVTEEGREARRKVLAERDKQRDAYMHQIKPVGRMNGAALYRLWNPLKTVPNWPRMERRPKMRRGHTLSRGRRRGRLDRSRRNRQVRHG
jgi:hypothetical protein